jgi:hypothetical protein
MVPALRQAQDEIMRSDSPVLKQWLKGVYIAGYVPTSSPNIKTGWHKGCREAKHDTVVVLADNNWADRRLTGIARVIFGNDRQIEGDMHALGLGIDIDSLQNWEYFRKRPLVTNIPPEVSAALMKNGFVWLGSSAGRDAMHFQYMAPDCFNPPTPKYLSGDGCCLITTKVQNDVPEYEECMENDGKNTTYEGCLGPAGTPGATWIKKTVD